MQAAHTILSGGAIAQALRGVADLGRIEHCELLRRGFNEVYEVRAQAGRFVARLAALRARGPSNTAYELAFLAHVRARGAGVAAGVGGPVQLALPEGTRDLTVFQYVDGSWPDSAEDFELTGQELARIHEAAQGYKGAPSLYTLDIDHLVERPLAWLNEAPTMDADLRESFSAVAQQVRRALGDGEGLALVACHGDCHGGNNFILGTTGESRRATFFDFDDAGPGWLAYDLAVLLWAQIPRRIELELGAETAAKYKRFLDGYRRVRPLCSADLEAVPALLVARHIWLLGEYASRRHHWGSQAIPTVWLRNQVPLMRSWMDLRPPT
jgi:Ser/Thr protein kinase RdoA (MazF antagonist)